MARGSKVIGMGEYESLDRFLGCHYEWGEEEIGQFYTFNMESYLEQAAEVYLEDTLLTVKDLKRVATPYS